MKEGTASASFARFSSGDLNREILIKWISRALYGINLYHNVRVPVGQEEYRIELADERDALLSALKYLGSDPCEVLSIVTVSCKSEDFA